VRSILSCQEEKKKVKAKSKWQKKMSDILVKGEAACYFQGSDG